MSKKNKKKERLAWKRHCFAVSMVANLKKECDSRDHQSENANDGGDDGAIKLNTLAAVLGDKTSMVYEALTLKGYLVTIVRLFKIAFLHKKANGIVKTIWGFVE